MDRFVSVARIVKKRGIRGEVTAELLTDFPKRFSLLKKVRVFSGGQGHWEELESYWFHKGRVVLKFFGRDGPEEVEELIGADVQVPEEKRFPPPSDYYYHSDLIGCTVFEHGNRLGTVTEIFETGAESSNLVVTDPDGKEIMVPLVRKFVLAVDIREKLIQVELPGDLTTGL